MNFKEAKLKVLSIFGWASFTPDAQGHDQLTEEQRTSIRDVMGEAFLSDFERNLRLEAEGKDTTVELAAEARKLEQTIASLNTRLGTLENEKMAMQTKIDELAKTPEEDTGLKEVEVQSGARKVPYLIPTKAQHYQLANDVFAGRRSLDSISATTIDVTELNSEFGTFVSQSTRPILKYLLSPIDSVQHMTDMQAIEKWQMALARLTSIVQQWIPKWTPSGAVSVTPNVIWNRHHKINVPLTPADIVGSWIAHLHREDLDPMMMPITLYIINELILPQVDDDRENLLLATGEYVALNPSSVVEGQAGQATGYSMDGYITILKAAKLAGDTNYSFPTLDAITASNVKTHVENFIDALPNVLKRIPGNVLCDPDIYTMYKRRYQDIYPNTKNDDKFSDVIDFTNKKLVPVTGMLGTGSYFFTPKWNFIHLTNINKGASRIFIERHSMYNVQVAAEWYEGVGFGIQEYVHAYVPEAGSGSGS